MLVIGSREQISFEIGTRPEQGLLIVDIWCAGLQVTYFDNNAHPASFGHSMSQELARIRHENPDCPQPFLRFGPTTDDVQASILKLDSTARLNVHLANGLQGSTDVPIDHLLGIYEKVIAQLGATGNA